MVRCVCQIFYPKTFQKLGYFSKYQTFIGLSFCDILRNKHAFGIKIDR